MKITSDSHVDHGLTQEQRDWLVNRFADRTAFFIESVTLPEELGTVPCGLYGPAAGDPVVAEADVLYQRRGPRQYDSRMVRRPSRPTKTVTVIAGPHADLPCVLYTAFGGALSPKEPGDASLADKDREESQRFWAQHALATE